MACQKQWSKKEEEPRGNNELPETMGQGNQWAERWGDECTECEASEATKTATLIDFNLTSYGKRRLSVAVALNKPRGKGRFDGKRSELL